MASSPLLPAVILYVPPVTLRASLLLTAFPSVEFMVRVPVPLRTKFDFANITASRLVSPSAVKVPVTLREFSESVVVTNTLSAFLT